MCKYEEIEKKEIFKNKHISVYSKKLKLPNEKVVDWTFLGKRDSVGMLGVFEDDTILLVRQYRPAVGEFTLEIPAGLLNDNENPKDGACREFEEETGYVGTEVVKICDYLTSPGMSDGRFYLYYSENLVKSTQHLDNDEFVEVVRVKLKDIEVEKLSDAKTIIAVQYAKTKRNIK